MLWKKYQRYKSKNSKISHWKELTKGSQDKIGELNSIVIL